MKTLRKILFPISAVLLIVGCVFHKYGEIAFVLGLALLPITFIIERMYLKRRWYRVKDLSERCDYVGNITIETGQLLISDKWSLEKCLKLNGFNGCYNINVSEMFKSDFSLISKIEFINEMQISSEIETHSSNINVDTGWLLFLVSSEANKFSPKKLKTIIQQDLKKLPEGKPLFLWLKNEVGKKVGVVIATGEGDGVYKIKYKTDGSKLLAIEVRFIKKMKMITTPDKAKGK